MRRIHLKGDQCIYCGQLANTIEHFPPQSYCAGGFLLPACRECNTLAGTLYPTNFNKRVECVKNKLFQRHRKAFEMPTWDIDDLNELEGNIKRNVKLWQNKKRIASNRIAWSAESYLCSIDRNNDFVRMDVEAGIIIAKEN